MKQRELASFSVLGVLAEEQVATLNQIHEKLRHSFGRYWGASTSILIPTISQLEDEGHLNATTADGNYAYEITPAGRDRLAEHGARRLRARGPSVPQEGGFRHGRGRRR